MAIAGSREAPAEGLPEGPAELTAAETLPAASRPEHEVVLDIRNLRTYFFTYDGVVKALDGVSFKVRRGETTGLVGETGCGKSVTAFSVTRLIPDPPGRVMGGSIYYREANLLWDLENEARYKPIRGTNRVKIRRSFRRIRASTQRLTAVRGKRIAMIFQEPSQAMNPIFSIADQLGETLYIHDGIRIIDELLGALPDDPEVLPAIDEVVEAAREEDTDHLRARTRALGDAVHLVSFGREIYYLARACGPDSERLRRGIRHALRRLRLTRFQRSYLASERRRLKAQEALQEVYLEEMTEGREKRLARLTLSQRMFRERLAHFYFGMRGVRGRVGRPVKSELFWRSVGLLEGVSIANPNQVARGYPHELSGGMLQRVMIAMALSTEPDILLADEPTTALDVTIQAQILELMRDLKQRVGTAILLITHDLAVIAEVADRVCVMYAGVIVEQAPVAELFRRPLHPYTQGLLASIPRVDRPEKDLSTIPGSVPDLIFPPAGCRFHPRCSYAMPICKQARPPLTLEGPEHDVACYLYKGPVAPE